MDKTETWWPEGVVVTEQAWPLGRSAGCRAAPHSGLSLISPCAQRRQMAGTSESSGLSLTRVMSESDCQIIDFFFGGWGV